VSRQRIPMRDGKLLVIGWDDPFDTWFALLYDDGDENAPPAVAIGYHPSEQAILLDERPDAVVGPYPVENATDLPELVARYMGIEADEKQPPCIYCHQPSFERNDDCGDRHPWNRLRFGDAPLVR
jgi:hypothetical protein